MLKNVYLFLLRLALGTFKIYSKAQKIGKGSKNIVLSAYQASRAQQNATNAQTTHQVKIFGGHSFDQPFSVDHDFRPGAMGGEGGPVRVAYHLLRHVVQQAVLSVNIFGTCENGIVTSGILGLVQCFGPAVLNVFLPRIPEAIVLCFKPPKNFK